MISIGGRAWAAGRVLPSVSAIFCLFLRRDVVRVALGVLAPALPVSYFWLLCGRLFVFATSGMSFPEKSKLCQDVPQKSADQMKEPPNKSPTLVREPGIEKPAS